MKSTARPCPHCQQLIRLTDDYLRQYGGRVTACSGCGQQFTLPTVDEVFPANTSTAGAIQYASSAPAQAAAGDGIWRDGWYAYVNRGAQLPEVCFRCAAGLDLEPVEFHLESQNDRKSGQVAAGAAAGGLLGAAVAAAVLSGSGDNRITIRAYACPRHRSNLNIGKLLFVVLIAVTIFLFVGGVFVLLNTHMPTLGSIMMAAALPVGIVAYILKLGAPAGLIAVKVDSRGAYVSGFGREFLLRLKSLEQARRDYTSQVAQNLGATSDD